MPQESSITLRDLISFIRRGLLLALLVAVVAAVVAYLSTRKIEPTYQAEAIVSAAQTGPSLGQLGGALVTASPLDPNAYRIAGLSGAVLQDALTAMGQTKVSEQEINSFRKKVAIRTERSDTSSLIYVDASDHSPQVAAAGANAVATALVNWDKNRASQSLDQVVTSLQQQIDNLGKKIRSLQAAGNVSQTQINGVATLIAQKQDQLTQAQVLRDSATGLLSVIQGASVPLEPSAPHPALNAAVAFVLGLALIYALLLLRDALNTRLRDVDDLAAVSGQPVLAVSPTLPKGTRRLPREASNFLRTNLLFATAEAHPKVILVTSARASEGKTSVALSLAESFARDDYRTLLIDADLRKPTIAKEYHLDAKRHVPLRAYLENPRGSYEMTYVAINLTQHLDIVPTFDISASPTELLSRGFRECLDVWRQQYDVIVIDSAPLLAVADTLIVAPLCTGTVLVASQKNTDRHQLHLAVEQLSRIGARILGVVATHADGAQQGSSYGYGVDLETAHPSANTSAPARAAVKRVGERPLD